MQGTGTAEAMIVKGSVAYRTFRRQGQHPGRARRVRLLSPTPQGIRGKKGISLKQAIHVGAAGWKGKVVEGGLEGETNPHEGEARSSSRNNCLVAGNPASVISVQRPRLM